jgi:hypothetical protein
MFATVRRYTGLPEPVAQRVFGIADDVGALLAGAPGFCDLRMVRTREGLVVVLTGTDEASIRECGRRFVAWVDARVEGFRGGGTVDIWSGDVAIVASIVNT